MNRITRSLVAVVATAAVVAPAGALIPRADAASAADPVALAPSAARKAPALTIKRATTGRVVSGSKITFKGKGPKKLKGTRVNLQRKVGKKGKWVKVGSAKVSKKGTWKATGIATGVGKNVWRFKAKKKGNAYGSRTLTTKVFNWFYLYDLGSVDGSGFGGEEFKIGGRRYPKSVGGSGNSATDWGDYNLSYRCTTLDAWIGIDDRSETGTTAGFYVTLDGARTAVGSKGLGLATHISIDVRSRLRVRLEIDPTNSSNPTGYWAFGNAKVLCSGRP